MMVSGLTYLTTAFPRSLRDEFITLTDPFVELAFSQIFTQGEWNDFTSWSKSHYTLDAHIESILKYDKNILPEPTDSAWLNVKESSFRVFSSFDKVQAIPISHIERVPYHQGTSAGFGYTGNPPPNPGRKGEPDQPNYIRALGVARKIAHECVRAHNEHRFESFIEEAINNSTPDIAFTRTQLVELPNTKVRNVFGAAFHYILLEGLYASPLIDFFMNHNTFYYIGEDPTVDVPKVLYTAGHSEATYLSIDWTAFDASVQPYEIELAFNLLQTMIVFPTTESRLVFEYCKALFMKRKLLSPDGSIYMRYSGVPSGSYFTHIVDSIINWIRIQYLLSTNNIRYTTILTHGDDGFVEITSPIHNFHYIADQANQLGWYINSAKCKLTGDISQIEFLGRSSLHGVNYRDRLKCLRLCLYPEYPVNDPQISIARLKAIFIDSGGNIPEIPRAIELLVSIHGDNNSELPRHFKTYKPQDRTRHEGI
jgi:hypothetical protein